MPHCSNFKAPFCCDQFYHLVFKSVDGLLLFNNNHNRTFFLDKFAFYTNAVFQCFAWCQLDNHAHFIVHTPTRKVLQQSIDRITDAGKTVAMRKFLLEPMNDLMIDALAEHEVNRFMISYANAFNRMFNRSGSLFQSFRRSTIDSDSHLQQAIIYVHANAQKHGLVEDYRLYPHSSFDEILKNRTSWVDAGAVLYFFGGKEKFIDQHEKQVAHYYRKNWPSSIIEV